MFFKERGSHIKINDIISDLKNKEPSLISKDASIEDVVKMIIGSGSDTMIYVVDDDDLLIGTISIDELVRNIFASSHEVSIHPRRLMNIVTSETARHIMKKNPSYAQKDDYLADIVKKMIKAHARHIALLDDKKKVIGDIAFVELIKILLRLNNMVDLTER
jgi:CBS domain-containing protein